MSSRIVLRDEIQNQINMIGALSGDVPAGNVRSYKELHDSINTTLSSAQEAVGRRLGKNYTEQIKQLNRRTTTLYQTSMVAFDVLVKCRDTYQGMDQYLRTQADGVGDYSWCDNPATQSVTSYSVVDKYNNHEKIPTNTEFYPETVVGTAENKRTFSFNRNGGCTWYAYNRYHEVTGKELVFTNNYPLNAKNWAEYIDTNHFNKLDLKNDNSVKIVPHAIGVTTGGGLGHVVYVETVQDGNVYYSESSFSNTSIAGQIKCESIEDFKKEFDYLITAKE